MPQVVNPLTGTGNGLAAIDPLDPVHYSRYILGQGHMAARQFAQGPHSDIFVKHRRQLTGSQPLRQFAGIDAVVLASLIQKCAFARIAHQDAVDMRL